MQHTTGVQYQILTLIRRAAHSAVGSGRSPKWYRQAVKAYFRRRLFESDSQTVRVRNGYLTGIVKRGPFCERDIDFAEGKYEPEVSEALRKLTALGAIVCDVGANAGYHTVLLSRLVGRHGRVHAFEPAPLTVGWLRDTISSNELTNVDIHEVAITDQVGVAEMTCAYALDGFASLRRGGHGISDEEPQCVTVRTTTFDDWLEANPLSRLDLIKLDIEGAELLALKGMKRALGRFQPAIVCEFWGATSIKAGHHFLDTSGYKCETLESWSGWVAGRHETVETVAAVSRG